MYFEDLDTLEECKALYKVLSKKLHPDLGGNAETFSAMKDEYEKRIKELEELNKPPFWLSEEYLGLGQAVFEFAKFKKPEQAEKTKIVANSISNILSLIENKQTNNIKSFLDNVFK